MGSNSRRKERGKTTSGKRKQARARPSSARRYEANFKSLQPEEQNQILAFYDWVRSLLRRD